MKCNGKDGTDSNKSFTRHRASCRSNWPRWLGHLNRLSSQSSPHFYFRYDSHYIKVWPAFIRQVTLYFRNRRCGAALLRYKRKSPLTDHRSYVLTEALSGVFFSACRRKSFLVKCEHMKVEMILAVEC